MKNRFYLIIFILSASFYSCKKNRILPIDDIYRLSATMTVDGLERTYTLNLPPNYYEAADFSFIIAMHGGGGNAG